jgi:methionyl-tRNA formyltransferase
MIRVVFMGSAEIACKSLDVLMALDAVQVVGVVTQPDRCKGRNLKLCRCPAKEHVRGTGIEVFSPDSINTPEALAHLQHWKPDLVVVMAYGQILKQAVLEVAPLGCINVHTSLLPAYRGAAPIQWAIANGDRETGVTIMYMDEGMDTGDILGRRRVMIGNSETAGELHDRLAEEGALALQAVVEDVIGGRVKRQPQDESQASYAPKLSKRDGLIDWNSAAEAVYDRVRGFNPWPCCFTFVKGVKRGMLRVLESSVEDACGEPGEILDVKGGGPLVGCGQKSLRLLRVQPEGKRVMTGREYICGHSMQLGDMVGDKT